MNVKRWIALIAAIFLFFISLGGNLAASVIMSDFPNWNDGLFNKPNTFTETIIEEGSDQRKILVLEVNGVIQDTGEVAPLFNTPGYNHRAFIEMIDQATDDRTVKGIILRVNSPGGGVVESAEIHKRLTDLKEETGKPIYVSMGTMAASGGYYISMAADKVYASPETITGSLGVIMQSINYGGFAEKYGITFETIKSGPYKDIMSPTREMSEEERAILQTLINNSYEAFVEVIATGRQMPISKVKELADGRIYDGRQAEKLNLVDDLGYYDDVIETMRDEQGLANASLIQYEQNIGLGSLFVMSARKWITNDLEVSVLTELLNRTNSPRLLYLYSK